MMSMTSTLGLSAHKRAGVVALSKHDRHYTLEAPSSSDKDAIHMNLTGFIPS
jgi:hypothetical protein